MQEIDDAASQPVPQFIDVPAGSIAVSTTCVPELMATDVQVPLFAVPFHMQLRPPVLLVIVATCPFVTVPDGLISKVNGVVVGIAITVTGMFTLSPLLVTMIVSVPLPFGATMPFCKTSMTELFPLVVTYVVPLLLDVISIDELVVSPITIILCAVYVLSKIIESGYIFKDFTGSLVLITTLVSE